MIPAYLAAATVQKSEIEGTGQLVWKVEDNGFSLELMQLAPDYVRAFYASRNRPQELIDSISVYCVFGSVAMNTSRKELTYQTANWRYITDDGKSHALKTRTDWLGEWTNLGVRADWSLLPDSQTFAPGDWNQGFTTIKLPRHSNFDLVYTWAVDGEKFSNTISKMQCAPEQLSGGTPDE
jgi:hypothetical protein